MLQFSYFCTKYYIVNGSGKLIRKKEDSFLPIRCREKVLYFSLQPSDKDFEYGQKCL